MTTPLIVIKENMVEIQAEDDQRRVLGHLFIYTREDHFEIELWAGKEMVPVSKVHYENPRGVREIG